MLVLADTVRTRRSTTTKHGTSGYVDRSLRSTRLGGLSTAVSTRLSPRAGPRVLGCEVDRFGAVEAELPICPARHNPIAAPAGWGPLWSKCPARSLRVVPTPMTRRV
jgi:hypothetical protein